MYELGIVPILKVGAADRALEEGITGEEYATLFGVEAHTSCRVSRGSDAFQCARAKGEYFVIV